MPSTPAIDQLLEGLNQPQRDAVTHPEGPLLVLAGAGSGKTRVLTHRIAWLVHTERARAGEILAITFTNKAAQEMRERVELLLGRSTRAMWVMTFHAACARILRAEAPRLGYTRQYTIYDQADARRLVKRCLDDINADSKRFTPAAVLNQISDAKNRLRSAEDLGQMVGGYFEQTVAECYRLYESELIRMNAMDFDDLLMRTVNVLELFPEVRARYAAAFRHVLVDEYQDTNHAQYRLLQLIAAEHRNLLVVGDEDQCLVEGTLVTMGDGSVRPIEDVCVGDEVLSSYGSGDFRPAQVTNAFRTDGRTQGVRIRTAGGHEVISTPEHVHFAGYRVGLTPDLHATYVMQKRDKGFRVGTTRTYARGQRRPVMGFSRRALHEHADAAWIVSTHPSEGRARVAEAILSLRYGLPTLPFVARQSRSANTLVGEQALIDEVFAAADSEAGGLALLRDEGLNPFLPHHQPQSHGAVRRVLTVTLCGDARGRTPMHRVALAGRDGEGRKALERLGLNPRPAKGGGWKFESAYKDAGAALAIAERISAELDVTVRCVGRLGRDPERESPGFSLPFTTAAAVRPGMVMFTADSYDVVETVERVELDVPVYDIDVEATHNFVANGLVTHNSVYSFRGADIQNILGFQDDFPEATTIRLEQNYRSTQVILDAANAVISRNRGRLGKTLWTDLGEGDPIRIRELDDEYAEGRYVVGEIDRLVDEGVSLSEIVCFYRTNAMSRVLEDTLTRREIPYQVVGGTKFYERAVVKDAIAYLTTLTNPQDAISFARCVNVPKRGIGQTSLSKVRTHADTMGISIWDAAADPAAVPGLGTAAVRALERFMTTMAGLREKVRDGVPVGDLLEAVLHESGYVEALEAERTFEAQGNLEILEQLVEVGREFDARAADAEGDTLDLFLQQVALVADADTRQDDEGLVTLMTLHNAKGLEYPIVFMVGCEEGVFPHSRALDEGGLEEERRLCYVGITRAMRELTMTFARRRNVFGSATPGLPSRFLAEIPPDLVDEDSRPSSSGSAMRATTWSSAQGSGGDGGAGGGASTGGTVDYRMGDDVVHPAFGDGVVTGTEPGGIVVVRFAKDGSERKLMASYAPLAKR